MFGSLFSIASSFQNSLLEMTMMLCVYPLCCRRPSMCARINPEMSIMAVEQDTVLRGQTRNEGAMVFSCLWETAAQVLRSTSQEWDGQKAGESTGHVDITRICGNPSGQSNYVCPLQFWIALKGNVIPQFRSVLAWTGVTKWFFLFYTGCQCPRSNNGAEENGWTQTHRGSFHTQEKKQRSRES